MRIGLISFLILFFAGSSLAQEILPGEDSICQFGRKYDRPEWKQVIFPAMDSSAAYKLAELRKAVPATWYLNEDSSINYDTITSYRNWLNRIYQYYFLTDIVDYDEKGDSTYRVQGDSVLYKLKDTYVFDINGDGLPDIIDYPRFYRRSFMDGDIYDIFLQQKDGSYKMINFDGFIYDITFNSDNTLNSLKTFSTSVYSENHNAAFFWYTFDKIKNDLLLTKYENVLKCQLRK